MILSAAVAEARTAADRQEQGAVSIRTGAVRSEVIAGEDVYYTIEAWNRDSRTQRDLSVSFTIDGDSLEIVRVPDGAALVSPRILAWSLGDLFAGRTWKVTFPVRVRAGTPVGETMTVIARISGPGVDGEKSVLAHETTVGVAVLPATGGTLDIAFVVAAIMASTGLLVAGRSLAAKRSA